VDAGSTNLDAVFHAAEEGDYSEHHKVPGGADSVGLHEWLLAGLRVLFLLEVADEGRKSSDRWHVVLECQVEAVDKENKSLVAQRGDQHKKR